MTWSLLIAATLLAFTSPLTAMAQPTQDPSKPLFKDVLPGVSEPKINLPRFSNLFGASDEPRDVLQKLLTNIVRWLGLIAGIVAFGVILWGGYRYITAGPNPAALQEFKDLLWGTFVGIMILALAYALIRYLIAFFQGQNP